MPKATYIQEKWRAWNSDRVCLTPEPVDEFTHLTSVGTTASVHILFSAEKAEGPSGAPPHPLGSQ